MHVCCLNLHIPLGKDPFPPILWGRVWLSPVQGGQWGEEGCTWHQFFTLLHACLCMVSPKGEGLFLHPGTGLAHAVFWPIARGGVVVSGCW